MAYTLTELQDTIVAPSTAPGVGAIGIIRLDGAQALPIIDAVFKGKVLAKQASHTLHFGTILQADGSVLDEVVVGLYLAPNSYTGNTVVEINCHGSPYIMEQLLQLLIAKGARLAQGGEFTMRAFLNGKMQLDQAEAVADVIVAESAAAHRVAMHHMRQGYSAELQSLREQLIKFAALLELELDFGEEDVEFAQRSDLLATVERLQGVISQLISSFSYGNALKKGVPVAIVGSPNVGKSTLLNALLNEERAIVTPIAGTTRDVVEDTITIDGYLFRFIDTAGLRETDNEIEAMGIQRTKQQITKATIILYVATVNDDLATIIDNYKANVPKRLRSQSIIVLNKADTMATCHTYDVEEALATLLHRQVPVFALSAKQKTHLEALQNALVSKLQQHPAAQQQQVLTNARHYEAFTLASAALQAVTEGLQQHRSTDLVALDLRYALDYLAAIFGEVTNDHLLDSIFRDFCIGK